MSASGDTGPVQDKLVQERLAPGIEVRTLLYRGVTTIPWNTLQLLHGGFASKPMGVKSELD